MYQVSSEIYKETDFQSRKGSNGKLISKFKFRYPQEKTQVCDIINEVPDVSTDEDGDLVVSRRRPSLPTYSAEIVIEHSEATELSLVGLQVWRGALLLADFLFHNSEDFRGKQILELGAGVGLSSIAAAICGASQVVCTDVDVGGILNLMRANMKRNQPLLKGNVKVLEYDFMQRSQDYAPVLLKAIDDTDIVLAADVIYDDQIIDAFINVIDELFKREAVTGRRKTIYMALEKRFVFTMSELDTVAPMFEYFLKQTMRKVWRFQYIPIDFPQFFDYERCKQLVLLKLTSS